MKKRIDVHAHYLPPAYQEMLAKRNLTKLDGGFPKPDWNEEIQFRQMELLSVQKSFLSISSPHLHMGDAKEAVETARACNEYGSNFSKRYPDQIAVMASLPLPEIEESVCEIRYCVENLQVAGFSLLTNSRGLYLGDEHLDPVMEELDRYGAVVALHPTEPSAVPENVNELMPLPFMEFFFDTTRAVANMILNGVLSRYPNIKFIVPHAGAYLPILSDRMATLSKVLPADAIPGGQISVMEDLKKLYYDLGGIVVPKQLGVLRLLADDSHLLYGSDGPFTPEFMCKKLADDLDAALDEKLAEMVFWENAENLLSKGIQND